MTGKTAESRLAAGTAGAFVLLAVAHTIFISAGGDGRIVASVPDDAFYYLILASNFVELGRWTFDGVAPATGFQILFAYFLAGFFRLAPALTLVQTYVALATILTIPLAASVWLIVRALERFCQPGILLVAIAMLTFTLLDLNGLLMEAVFSLLFEACLFYLAFAQGGRGLARCAGAFAAGILGSLSRADFGLFAAAMFAAALVAMWRGRRGSVNLAVAGWGLAGAVVGLGALFLHTFLLNGQWFQASIAVKSHWGDVIGFSPMQALRQFLIIPAPYLMIRSPAFLLKLALLALSAGSVAYLGFYLWRKRGYAILADPLLILSGLSIAGYAVVYGFNSGGLQIWYNANIVIPAAALACLLGSWIGRADMRAAGVLAGFLALLGLGMSAVAPFPWQIDTLRGGEYLRAHPELKPAGAWNAGVVAYFAGGGVVNIDGLMNDTALPYILNGKLADYIVARGLRSIIDSEGMLTDPTKRRRGGYADGTLDGLLRPGVTLSDAGVATPYRIWEIGR